MASSSKRPWEHVAADADAQPWEIPEESPQDDEDPASDEDESAEFAGSLLAEFLVDLYLDSTLSASN